MGASKRVAEEVVLAHAPADAAYSRRSLRERPRQPGQCHPDFRPTDRGGRPDHGDRPPHDPLLHERRRGGPARAAGFGPVPGWRDLHAGDGRAGADPRPGPTHDPPVGPRRGHRDPGADDRAAARGEAPRRAEQPRRGGLPHPAPLHPAPGAGERLRRRDRRPVCGPCARPCSSATPPLVRDLLFSLTVSGTASHRSPPTMRWMPTPIPSRRDAPVPARRRWRGMRRARP